MKKSLIQVEGVLNTGLFAAFGALNLVLHTQGLTCEKGETVRWAMTIVSIGGLIINLTLAKSLSRQEYIRQWYFHIFPKNLPLMPHEEWLKKNITTEYNMDYPKPGDTIEKANKELIICKLGKIRPGFCESWIYTLFVIAGVFLFLAGISWHI